ncbi:MAG TPA: hypothetical protein VFX59_29335 [Polyangiales bacterium]|nr:hypothetical protein [Polyangiales bacterium]
MRPALLLVALTMLAWSYAPANRAMAQAINSNAKIYVGTGKALENGSNVYINSAQCNDEQWRFELQGYSTLVPFLELWVTNNSATDCTQQANRSSANNTQPVCWQVPIGGSREVPYLNSVRTKLTITVPGRWIFNNDRDLDNDCDPGIAGTPYKLQFVTLASPTQGNTATVTESNRNANQISALLTLYSKIPVAPANARARSGETTIGIRYDKIDNDPLTRYRAVFDHALGAPAIPRLMDGGFDLDGGSVTCGTGAFDQRPDGDAGTRSPTGSEVIPDNAILFQSDRTNGESVSIGDLDRKGIALNSFTQVSVYAIDGAGNAGYLSTPVCVQRQETLSYLDTCRDAGTDCGELDSCSLSPRNTGSAFWLSACTLALSAWARRRRRSN